MFVLALCQNTCMCVLCAEKNVCVRCRNACKVVCVYVQKCILVCCRIMCVYIYNFLEAVNIYVCVCMIAEICVKSPVQGMCLHDGYPDPKNCNRCRCPTGLSGIFCQTANSYQGKAVTTTIIQTVPPIKVKQ